MTAAVFADTDGPKLKEATPDAPSAGAESTSGQPRRVSGPTQTRARRIPIPSAGDQTWMLIMGGKCTMRGHNETTAQMPFNFANQIGRPVVDGTGLRGRYDYIVNWSTVATRDVLAPLYRALNS